MCGGTDIIKKDGVFVCQTCGTKYSIEEAKKMIVEGNVDVSGSTVKVDSSDRIEKLYELARRENERFGGDAAKYYEEIAIARPNDWEATFYNDYYKVSNAKLGGAADGLFRMIRTVKTTFELVEKYEVKKDYKKITDEVASKCNTLAILWQKTAENSYKKFGVTEYARPYADISSYSFSLREVTSDYLIEFFGFEEKAVELYKSLVDDMTKAWIGYIFNENTKKLIEKIKKYDASYSAPSLPSKSGCYVATAVYGSYDCPEVWTLRRYRDYNLAETWHGRAFIHIYYAISPTIVKLFGHTEWFKKMWRGKLDRMVKNLQDKGYESTPYEDHNW
jgi:uncharacterized Zn finger protein (UPF0148 family)